MDGEQLERLNEVAEAMAAVRASLQTIEGQVALMNKALFLGNGRPSMMTRLEILEMNQTTFATQCKECKAIILTSSKKNDEGKTLIVVERWKAVTAIVTAIVASPVLIAIVAALLNK